MKKKKKEFHPDCRTQGFGKKCFFCGKEMTEKQMEEKNNFPVECKNIPGYVHRRCRGIFNKNLIENPYGNINLSKQYSYIKGMI